jgi:pimeloyl-ACP methyl ester carboxylesterase
MKTWSLHGVFGVLAGVLVLMATPALAQQRDPSATVTSLQVGGDTFTAVTIEQINGPPVHYTISRTVGRKPLVLYIQGSGCAPAFFEMQPGVYASTVFSLTTQAHRGDHAVMIVDKPFAAVRPPASGGLSVDCSAEFNRYFTLDNWVNHIALAVAHARQLPWVDPDRILVIGVSEGATAAAALVAKDPGLTSVAMVGASGTSQLYDFVVAAYQAKGDDSALAELNDLSAQVSAIQADPESTTKFAWGHPYRRWNSFMAFSAAEALTKSKARVYLVSGMADVNVPILSTEVLYSMLRAKGRSVLFRRIPQAGHSLIPDDADFGANMPRLEAEFQRIIDWFDGKP